MADRLRVAVAVAVIAVLFSIGEYRHQALMAEMQAFMSQGGRCTRQMCDSYAARLNVLEDRIRRRGP